MAQRSRRVAALEAIPRIQYQAQTDFAIENNIQNNELNSLLFNQSLHKFISREEYHQVTKSFNNCFVCLQAIKIMYVYRCGCATCGLCARHYIQTKNKYSKKCPKRCRGSGLLVQVQVDQ